VSGTGDEAGAGTGDEVSATGLAAAGEDPDVSGDETRVAESAEGTTTAEE